MARIQARDFSDPTPALKAAVEKYGATHVVWYEKEAGPAGFSIRSRVRSQSSSPNVVGVVYSYAPIKNNKYIERKLEHRKGLWHWPRDGKKVKSLPLDAERIETVMRRESMEAGEEAGGSFLAAQKRLLEGLKAKGWKIEAGPDGFANTATRDGDRIRIEPVLQGAIHYWGPVRATRVALGHDSRGWADIRKISADDILRWVGDERRIEYQSMKENPGAGEARRGPACGPDVRKAGWVHRGGCHPARPLCRMARREKGLCYCTAYSYPHREGSGMCVQGPEGSARFERHVHGPERQFDLEPEPIPEDESFGAWVRRNPMNENPIDDVLDDWGLLPGTRSITGRRKDGQFIRTSNIIEVNGRKWSPGKGRGLKSNDLVITQSGSVYRLGTFVARENPRRQARECSCGVKENPVDENGIPWVKVERDPKIQEELVEIQDDFGPIAGSKDVYRLLSPWAVKQEQEHLLVVMTDIHSEIKGVALIHKGERDRVSVSPSDVLRPAIERSAAGLVLVHNHPSGRADHSKADADLTKAIREACDAANITFMDHVVLGTGEFYSFADKKLHKVKK